MSRFGQRSGPVARQQESQPAAAVGEKRSVSESSRPADAAVAVAPLAGRARRLVLGACMMATFTAAVESTIVATAMPSIAADLGGFRLFPWVFSAYLFTQAVSIPLYGRLADAYGRKPMFYLGTGLFMLGSGLSGLAGGMAALVGFRALQGLGAGAVQPIAYTIVGDIYTPAERARIQGVVSAVFGVAAIIGPSLGAFLVEHGSWRLIFWVNLPVAGAAIAMIAAFLPERIARARQRTDWPRTDWPGTGLLVAGVGALVVAAGQGGRWGLPVLGAVVASGLAALTLLARRSRRRADPVLPLDLFRDRVILLGVLGGFGTGIVIMGITAFVPTFVQAVLGRSVGQAGAVLAAMMVVWVLGSTVAGRAMLRTSYRTTALCGAGAMVAGCAWLARLDAGASLPAVAAATALVGFGLGFCNTTWLVAVQSRVAHGRRASATSALMFMRFLGQSVGAAASGAVLAFGLRRHVPARHDVIAVLVDPARRAALPAVLRMRLVGAAGAGLAEVYLLAAVLGLATLAIGWGFPAALSPRGERPPAAAE
jgi:EmrB/QacA subfamily drug resistance transporter